MVFRHLMEVSCSSWGSASSTFLRADAEDEKRMMVVSAGRGSVERNSASVSRPR
jgi:hypothetical protein